MNRDSKMKSNPFAFAKKLLLYLQKEELSADEKKEVEEVIRSNSSLNELYDELQDKEKISEQLYLMTSFDTEMAYKKVIAPKKKGKALLLVKLMTAAAVIALAIGIPLFYLTSDDSSYSSELIGTGVATLQTSGGKVIRIDTLTNLKLTDDLLVENQTGVLYINGVASKATKKGNHRNQIKVPYKGMYEVVLPDGTKVKLNSGSVLEFSDDFQLNDRVVTLEGEAFFDVVKSEGKRFIVKTKDMDIVVLGTKFNVKSYQDDMNTYTTLVEGKVELVSEGVITELLPGEQIVFENKTKAIDIKEVNITPIVAWSDQYFHFDNTPLEEIMKTLSRWYDLSIKYADDDPLIKSTVYSGRIKMYTHPEDVLRKFEKTGNLKFELKKNTIIISKK